MWNGIPLFFGYFIYTDTHLSKIKENNKCALHVDVEKRYYV